MKNLNLIGVQELNTKEIQDIDAGWWLRLAQALATAAVAYNEACGDCITKRIEESDDSLGGSRPFEG